MVETESKRIKIGAKVDEKVYKEFVGYVEEKRGQKRGVLGTELENALKEYMSDGNSPSSDVSNADILNEIRELRAASGENTPRTHTQTGSAGSGAGDGSDSATGGGPPRTHERGKVDESNLAGEESDGSGNSDEPPETINGVPVPDERPHYRASSIGERVAWIASTVLAEGKIPFDNLRSVVSGYHDYSDKKERDLAWRVAAVLSPSMSDLPDDVSEPDLDSDLRARKEFGVPRRTDGGAWFTVNAESRKSLKRQLPTQQGDVYVYLRSRGARDYCEDIGIDVSDSVFDSRPDEDEDEDSVSTDDFDGVDIDGAVEEVR